jgi:metallophosphoesterase (TIGR00282 family)
MTIKILTIGDIVGRPGRTVIKDKLGPFVEQRGVDVVIANGENSAAGSGIVPAQVAELTDSGVHVITTGDHIWKRAQIVPHMNSGLPLLRPANYPPEAKGRGHGLFKSPGGIEFGVVNLIGRVYMGPADCPYRAADAAVAELSPKTPLIIVDMHAEATSEKVAMGWHLDGRVTAVVGTHTHVPTADERVLPGGTAYITDLGMTGPYDSVLGRQTKRVLHKFTTSMYAHFDVASGDVRLCGALIEADADTGKAVSIERVCIRADR